MRFYVKKFLEQAVNTWFVMWCILGCIYLLFVLYIVVLSLTL